MKDLSFFFLKNSMGSKMRRSFRNMCKNDNSTSTLNQHYNTCYSSASSHVPSSSSCMENDQNAPVVPPRKSVTLEEMILQLELEEEMARREKAMSFKFNNKAKEDDDMRTNKKFHHRMSCVNSSDILRTARNALNQYPRFSLDGRDAMYRASFCPNLGPSIDGLKLGRILHLPQSLGGESVIWCKPGVVPKLMGLEAMPIPMSRIHNNHNHKNDGDKLSNMIKNQNLRQKAHRDNLERNAWQRRHNLMNSDMCGNRKRTTRGHRDGCALNGYCVMNPIALDHALGLGGPITQLNPHNCI